MDRKRSNLLRAIIACMGLMLLQLNSVAINAADDVPLSPTTASMGTDILTAGTGMELVTSGDINFNVPPGATIVQVLLYWEGYMAVPPDLPGDNQITVNGTDITGVLLTKGFTIGSSAKSYAYRDDITAIVASGVGGLGPGNKTLTITNMNFEVTSGDGGVSDGAGVMVILDDGTDKADIALREGNDFAFINGFLNRTDI